MNQLFDAALMHRTPHRHASQGFALVNALVLAKVMLIAEDLKFGGWFRGRPLVVPIVTDAALFAALFLVVHVLEEVIVGMIHGRSAASSVPAGSGRSST